MLDFICMGSADLFGTGRERKIQYGNSCFQRDSNSRHATQRQVNQRFRPLGHDALMIISCLMFHRIMGYQLIKECVSFFLGSWGMNRSVGQTNRVNREAVLVRFVCSALRFIPHEPREKDTHSLYLQCFQQRPFLKFSEESYKFKIPTVTGT